jgi:hypothetical protein
MADENPDPDHVARNFGLIIAYVFPGFVSLWTVSYFDDAVKAWLGRASSGSTTVGEFLLVVIASIGIGVFLNGVRCIIYDNWLKNVLGIGTVQKPADRKGQIPRDLIEDHYRFFQFYSSTSIAVLFGAIAWLIRGNARVGWPLLAQAAAFLAVEGVLVFSARDSILKFRSKALILVQPKKEEAS